MGPARTDEYRAVAKSTLAGNAKADFQAGVVPITANEYETALAHGGRTRALD